MKRPRELRRERQVVAEVVAGGEHVVAAARREEAAVALRAALVPAVAGVGVAAALVRARLVGGADEVLGGDRAVGPGERLVLVAVDAEAAAVAAPAGVEVARGRRPASRASGRTSGSPSSRRRRGRCRTRVAGSSSMLRPPKPGMAGSRRRQPGSAVTAAAAPPTSPARFRNSRRSIVIAASPQSPRDRDFLAAIYAIRQGLRPVRSPRCPALALRSGPRRDVGLPGLRRHDQPGDVGVHLLERLGRTRAGGRSTPSTTPARSAAGSACSTSGTCCPTTATCCAGSRPRCRSIRISTAWSAALRAAGAEVSIVSDGFGFYATERVRAPRHPGPHQRGGLGAPAGSSSRTRTAAAPARAAGPASRRRSRTPGTGAGRR